jgi:hypothetical protein
MAETPPSLADLISRLAEDADRIVGNPKDLPLLQSQGVNPQPAPKRTVEESLTLLFKNHEAGSVERAVGLPVPPSLAPPAVTSLYNEISTCIILGLPGAAITLTGIMIEFVLKYATYIREVGGFGAYDAAHWDEFERITFGPAIDRAERAGLITAKKVSELRRFKDAVRNPYNHYNIRKITGHLRWDHVKILDLKTSLVEEKTIEVKDDPVLQAQAKPIVDAQMVLGYFTYGDAVVKHLLGAIGYFEAPP